MGKDCAYSDSFVNFLFLLLVKQPGGENLFP